MKACDDSRSRPRCTSQIVNIQVTRTEQPRFNPEQITLNINENVPENSAIHTLIVNDPNTQVGLLNLTQSFKFRYLTMHHLVHKLVA